MENNTPQIIPQKQVIEIVASPGSVVEIETKTNLFHDKVIGFYIDNYNDDLLWVDGYDYIGHSRTAINLFSSIGLEINNKRILPDNFPAVAINYSNSRYYSKKRSFLM